MRSEKSYLRCDVRPGMFSNERVVTVVQADGQPESFFVPKDSIEEGRSRVPVIVHGTSGTAVVASLRTGDGDAVVTVKPDDIED